MEKSFNSDERQLSTCLVWSPPGFSQAETQGEQPGNTSHSNRKLLLPDPGPHCPFSLQALKHSGNVDFLVCVAGVNPYVGSTLGSSEEVWDKVRSGTPGRADGMSSSVRPSFHLSSHTPSPHRPTSTEQARCLDSDPQFPGLKKEATTSLTCLLHSSSIPHCS